ncbi:TetR/AcrR family transcriptional regulator [Deinococcus sp.]|uniref:TetR/AcrR family transcriptional regulator n=1 Tax=Deinococcus sp. TaxID=47478 RepID=UPI0025D8CC0C|nr:TetR/AcrR family transcriptional regulator [Deinococcus sp.]
MKILPVDPSPTKPSPTKSSPGKPLRADARRNRERLLATARELFLGGKLDFPLEDIARRSGVGVGTIYRHFETREALIEAVYQQEIGTLCACADELLGRLSADDALAAFLGQMIDYAANNRGLAAALCSIPDAPAFTAGPRLLMEAVSRLMRLAVAERRLRADVEPGTVLTVITSLCRVNDDPGWKAQAHAVVALLLDGLRLGVARP